MINLDHMFNRFNSVPGCNKRTDGRTDAMSLSFIHYALWQQNVGL